MSLSVQRSVVESFKFNDKNIKVVHIKNVGQCFVGIDMSKAVGYNDDDNARRAVRTHVPGKYRMRLGDAQNVSRREVDIDLVIVVIALSCFVKSLRPSLSWSGLWKQFYHGRLEN